MPIVIGKSDDVSGGFYRGLVSSVDRVLECCSGS